MKINVSKPNVVRIAYCPDGSDEEYNKCTWAFFDFDQDEWMLNIQSDVGNYAYGWPVPTEGETFLELCARMHGDYLGNKLFKDLPEEFDQEETLKKLKECLKDMDLPARRITRRIDDLRDELDLYDLDDCVPLAEYLIEKWNDDYELGIDNVYEYVVSRWSAWQKRIITIFENHIQPKLREMVEDGNGR